MGEATRTLPQVDCHPLTLDLDLYISLSHSFVKEIGIGLDTKGRTRSTREMIYLITFIAMLTTIRSETTLWILYTFFHVLEYFLVVPCLKRSPLVRAIHVLWPSSAPCLEPRVPVYK